MMYYSIHEHLYWSNDVDTFSIVTEGCQPIVNVASSNSYAIRTSHKSGYLRPTISAFVLTLQILRQGANYMHPCLWGQYLQQLQLQELPVT